MSCFSSPCFQRPVLHACTHQSGHRVFPIQCPRSANGQPTSGQIINGSNEACGQVSENLTIVIMRERSRVRGRVQVSVLAPLVSSAPKGVT
ncbi:hypothetical protein RRG08_033108 [Elysia crispata]|uniref:Uncharacterized protein n=1 Tax=Elysia crispata TaxID=231223 RepID=A0AAE1ECE7_9GAST|nr:hypothetical protein RRG08_033108 [Elysia crispata]